MKKYLILLVLPLLFIACSDDSTDSDNEIKVPVSVDDVKYGPIMEFIDATGTVYSSKEAVLRSEISGRYNLQINPRTGIPFKLGDEVKEGETIIKISDEEYENNIRIDYQKLQLEQKKSELEKQKSLFDKGGVTQRELKTAELDYINQQYTYENAEIQLKKMKVTAPFDGVIVDLTYYTPDVRINLGSPMLKLMDYKNLFLNVNLAEKHMYAVNNGQNARIMNYTIPDDTLKGKITQLSPAIDENTRTFKVVLGIDNSRKKLRPGMFVKAELIVAQKDSVIVIPKDIILSRQRGKTVFVVSKEVAQERVIVTGLETPDFVEVKSGLNKNERLVVRGFETLRNRQPVRIIK